MKLTTPVHFQKFSSPINFESRLMLMGSCFTEHIGKWLDERKFTAALNPLGISYNPMSIADQLARAMANDDPEPAHFVEFDGATLHLDAHSSLHGQSRAELGQVLASRYNALVEELRNADFLFLTFGTSWAFRSKHTGIIVNNCHRQAESNFERVLLDLSEMERVWQETLERLSVVNPDLKIVLTVSPIRHLRHGAVDNNRSKARLLLLCEALAKKAKNVTYLPVYEMVMDELRDYRFYRHDDMVHLNELGLAMVIERFQDAAIDSASLPLLQEIEAWLGMKNHRLTGNSNESERAFQAKLDEKTLALAQSLPGRFTTNR